MKREMKKGKNFPQTRSAAEFEYMSINSADILVSQIYQRHYNQRKVERIVKEFNPNLVNPPKLSFRNGKYYVFDGQHTIAALKDKNGGRHLNIMCKVYYGLTELDETELFLQQNGVSSQVHANEKLRALYNIGDADVTDMVRLCESAGFCVDFGSRNKNRNRILAVKTLFDVYMAYGPENLLEVLSILREAWAGIPDSLVRNMIAGMALFCVSYRGEY